MLQQKLKEEEEAAQKGKKAPKKAAKKAAKAKAKKGGGGPGGYANKLARPRVGCSSYGSSIGMVPSLRASDEFQAVWHSV